MTQITDLLANQINNKQGSLIAFFEQEFNKTPAPLYNSVDIRNSGFKISAVDTNCFPAGFNNLSSSSIKKAQKQVAIFFAKNFPEAKNILIIPESHSRNLNYLQNVYNLQIILSKVATVKIGTLIEEVKQPTRLKTFKNDEIEIHPIINEDGRVFIHNFVPDVLILNNDLSEGLPNVLKKCKTPIIPNPNIGWYNRSKFNHFKEYNKIANQVAEILEIDPWLISTIFDVCGNINFKESIGIDNLAQKVDELLLNVQQKYQQLNIDKDPYCFVKADSGTYGMAVWQVRSAADILAINKKDRNKMNVTKGSVINTKVMIQEGIPTLHKIDKMAAESLIYMISGEVVGNLYRVNSNRDEISSLNSAGAIFYDGLDVDSSRITPKQEKDNLLIANNLVSKIASLASAREIKLT
jgi:glutamate--cysteine ligase